MGHPATTDGPYSCESEEEAQTNGMGSARLSVVLAPSSPARLSLKMARAFIVDTQRPKNLAAVVFAAAHRLRGVSRLECGDKAPRLVLKWHGFRSEEHGAPKF